MQLLFLLICGAMTAPIIESPVDSDESDTDSTLVSASVNSIALASSVQRSRDVKCYDGRVADLTDGYSEAFTELTEKTPARRQCRFESDSTAIEVEAFDHGALQEIERAGVNPDCKSQSYMNPTALIAFSDIKQHASCAEYDAKICADRPIQDLLLGAFSTLSAEQKLGAFYVSAIGTYNDKKLIILKDNENSEEGDEVIVAVYAKTDIAYHGASCVCIEMQSKSQGFGELKLHLTYNSSVTYDESSSDDEPFFPMSHAVDPDDFTLLMERKLNEILTELSDLIIQRAR